ncbi:VOC family protein [Virgibacillus doumboii]|uniref:VOC family protein n=1 Tax=Virgibacillus doumboii TaxID=2697503 RepID=UPI0013E0A4D8|nr:VOC family protein [Virgibacillus doumboii]
MLALDHIIIAANDPQQAADDFAKKHGVKVLEGGRHESWGTHNYLAYFSNDCYLEWLGIFNENIAAQSDNPLIAQLVRALDSDVEGPIQYALRTDSMDDYLKQFNEKGIPYTGPIAGSRKRPDSSQLEWRMLFPKNKIVRYPFLIEWGDIKNVPSDSELINRQHIDTLHPVIANENDYNNIFQTGNQLENVQMKTSDMLGFSISK